MSYNPYGGGVPGFGPPPTYSSYPGANGPPPGMSTPPGLGPPPGMSAPGMAPPGVQQPILNQANRPSGLPSNFQAPPNMPNINFNAPVIRLGTIPAKPSTPGGPGRRDSEAPQSAGPRPGLGMERGVDHSRQAIRESMQALVPPTKEEIVRTIFVQGITDGIGGNAGIEDMLNIVGNLRRWERATDASGKEMPFGFAQFEDAESLWVASELLREIQIPTKKQAPAEAPADADDSYESFDKTKLQFKLDENTTNYLESYVEGRTNESDAEARLSAAIGALKQTVRNFFYPPLKTGADADGDVTMGNAGQSGESVEVVNIPLAQDDELADIPAEMRETVAAEIAAFRERSIKRDLERLKREEEFEAMERQRAAGNRPSRLASPPPGASTNTNNTPLGPRGVPNAPSGPKGQKTDLGKDYNRSVNFVNGGITNGGLTLNREDEDSDASDDELERRRKAKQEAETEKLYLDAERRWLNRERTRAAALERERERDETDEADVAKKRESMLDRFKHFDDDTEAARKKEEYYADRSAWIRNRTAFRAREIAADDADRQAEEQDRIAEEAEREQARGMADSFLNEQARQLEQRPTSRPGVAAPQPFKLSLGAAAQRAQAQRAAPQRKTIAEVEGLLEDEEEDNKKRTIVPIKFEPADAAGMSTEEREQAVRSLAQEIPNEKEGLWQWDIKWDFLDESVIRDKLRPFVEKKLVEYLGVMEELLLEVVEEHLRKHGKPAELVETLAEALDDEAEALVKKLWRMVIFYTESEKRGLSA
ncbi:putative PWI domain-containing protein [Seiridium cardinale]|uniref:PWI domain-containing protein n=1 Tax=Seiridium cardinale TaxID=138064 RepID=A0ABR2XXW6_9PEZI